MLLCYEHRAEPDESATIAKAIVLKALSTMPGIVTQTSCLGQDADTLRPLVLNYIGEV